MSFLGANENWWLDTHTLDGKTHSHSLQKHVLISSALNALIIVDVLKCTLQFEVNEDSELNDIASERECVYCDT